MLELQHHNQFFLFNFDNPHPQQEHFLDPAFWQQQQRILGAAKGRGTTWFVRSEDLFGVNCALRHYYRGGLWGKFNKDQYRFSSLEHTRSFAEFRLLEQLRQAGLPVPKPIGARVEKLAWGFYRADILTEKVENAQDLTALLQHSTLTAQGWQQIGSLIRRLHNLQICHTDLNAHNLLVQQLEGQQKYWLLDFDKCGQKSGDFWKAENLQRLLRSFNKEIKRLNIRFTPQNWQDLLSGYEQGGN